MDLTELKPEAMSRERRMIFLLPYRGNVAVIDKEVYTLFYGRVHRLSEDLETCWKADWEEVVNNIPEKDLWGVIEENMRINAFLEQARESKR